MPFHACHPRPPVVPILGMHRSGTSMLTRLVNLLGVDLGGPLQPAANDNPRGFWEHQYLQAVNINLLGTVQANPDGYIGEAQTLDVVRAIESGSLDPALLAGVGEALDARFSDATWGWKDPRNTLTYGFWRRVLAAHGHHDVRPIVVLREPGAWYTSLRRRGDVAPVAAAAGLSEDELLWSMWLGYHRALLELVQTGEALLVEVEALLDPSTRAAQVERLRVWLGLGEHGVAAALDWVQQPAPGRAEAAAVSVPARVRALHHELRVAVAGPTDYSILMVHPVGYTHLGAFDELALAVQHGLRELGHAAPLVRDPRRVKGRAIVFGAHLLEPGAEYDLPGDAILFNLEQLGDGKLWEFSGYLDRLRRHEVWSYSERNVESLRAFGVSRAVLCEPGFVPALQRIPSVEPDLDVLFYGTPTPRRVAVVKALRARGLRVEVLFDVYGEARDAMIARARVVLNVRHIEGGLLEAVRLSYLLANGRCVVSEGGTDPALKARYHGGVVFAPYDALVDVVITCLQDRALRERTAARGYEIFRACSQADQLQRAGVQPPGNLTHSQLPRLSLCMIVRDEQAFLPGALASVRGVVDEVVVVDTGSTDATVELALAAGARVERFVWCDDFAAARNFALERCTGDWVLVLDADERLAAHGGPALRAALQRDDLDCGLLPLFNARSLETPPPSVVWHGAGEAELLPRLFRKVDGLRWQGTVHENADAWLGPRMHRVHEVDAAIVHYGAVPQVRRERGKAERNLRLLHARCEVSPSGHLLAYLTDEHLGLGDLERAWEVNERAWSALQAELEADPLPSTTWVRVLVTRLGLQVHRHDTQGLRSTLRQGETWAAQHPSLAPAAHHANLYHQRGVALLLLADDGESKHERWRALGEAAACLSAALGLAGQPSTLPVRPEVTGWRSALALGHALLQLGDLRGAEAEFERVLATRRELSAALGRIEAWVGLGRFDEALEALEPLLSTGRDAHLLAAAAWVGRHDWSRAAPHLEAAGAPGPWLSAHRKRLLASLQAGAAASEALVFVGGAHRSGAEPLERALRAHSSFSGGEAGQRRCVGSAHSVLQMSELAALHPRARFVHVVRDGREVVGSLLRAPVTEVDGSVPAWSRDAGAATTYWCEVVQPARQEAAMLLGRVLEVRYEALVEDGERELRRVLAFLGEPWEAAVGRQVEVEREVEALTEVELEAVVGEGGYLLEGMGYLG
jgi:tetratricopeptide (TPR) repeat protein